MELPKHITQIGTIDATHKIYVEDYCISYAKQLSKEMEGQKRLIALYGSIEQTNGIQYIFIYGAALLGVGKERNQHLAGAEKQQAEYMRKEFFSGYKLVGVLLSEEDNIEDIYYFSTSNKAVLSNGYYIFYDKNEAMLNYMMQYQKEERAIDLDPVIIKKADIDREKKAKAEEEAKEVKEKTGIYRKQLLAEKEIQKSGDHIKEKKNKFPALVMGLAALVALAYGVRYYYPNLDIVEVSGYVSNYLRGMEQEELPSEGGEMVEEEQIETIDDNSLLETEGDKIEVPEPEGFEVVVIPSLEEIASQETEEAIDIEETEESVVEEIVEEETEEITEEVSVPAVTEYLIQKGDTLLNILRSFYGDESKMQEVCNMNGILDPNNIQVGQTILLP